MNLRRFFISVYCTILMLSVSAQSWAEIGKGLPNLPYERPLSSQAFGVSIDIDGNYAVVGSSGKGTAYVMLHNGSSWSTIAELTNSDDIDGAHFGKSVAIFGDKIVIGAPTKTINGVKSGCAYIFEKPSDGWKDTTETAILYPSDGELDNNFGNSVAMYGDNVVVGSFQDGDNGKKSGSAYVFTTPKSGWVDMTQTAKLLPLDGSKYDYFGSVVAIFENNIIVSAPSDDDLGYDSGSAYLFTTQSTVWTDMTHSRKFTAIDGASYQYFGNAIAIEKENIVIAAYKDDDKGGSSGSVYVLTKPTVGSWLDKLESVKLLASNGYNADYFGSSVAISGNYIAVGADGYGGTENIGAAYVFAKQNGKWENATEIAKLLSSDAKRDDNFGSSIAISDSLILIGTPGQDESGRQSGAVYSFTKLNDNWTDTTKTKK